MGLARLIEAKRRSSAVSAASARRKKSASLQAGGPPPLLVRFIEQIPNAQSQIKPAFRAGNSIPWPVVINFPQADLKLGRCGVPESRTDIPHPEPDPLPAEQNMGPAHNLTFTPNVHFPASRSPIAIQGGVPVSAPVAILQGAPASTGSEPLRDAGPKWIETDVGLSGPVVPSPAFGAQLAVSLKATYSPPTFEARRQPIEPSPDIALPPESVGDRAYTASAAPEARATIQDLRDLEKLTAGFVPLMREPAAGPGYLDAEKATPWAFGNRTAFPRTTFSFRGGLTRTTQMEPLLEPTTMALGVSRQEPRPESTIVPVSRPELASSRRRPRFDLAGRRELHLPALAAGANPAAAKPESKPPRAFLLPPASLEVGTVSGLSKASLLRPTVPGPSVATAVAQPGVAPFSRTNSSLLQAVPGHTPALPLQAYEASAWGKAGRARSGVTPGFVRNFGTLEVERTESAEWPGFWREVGPLPFLGAADESDPAREVGGAAHWLPGSPVGIGNDSRHAAPKLFPLTLSSLLPTSTLTVSHGSPEPSSSNPRPILPRMKLDPIQDTNRAIDGDDKTGRRFWPWVSDKWSGIPSVVKWGVMAIPLALALILHTLDSQEETMAQLTPEIGASVVEESGGVPAIPVNAPEETPVMATVAPEPPSQTPAAEPKGVLTQRWQVFRENVMNRAAISLADDFRGGLGNWQGGTDWAKSWSYDASGFIRPGALALYRPSLGLTDYQMEFTGQIEKSGVSWVFRAADLKNYFAARLVITKAGLIPEGTLVRYAVIEGKQSHIEKIEIPFPLRSGKTYQFQVDVRGSRFTTYLDGKVIDFFEDDRLPRGGVGFFQSRGERARLRWVSVMHQHDVLGRLCALIAPYSLDSPPRSFRQ